MKKVLLAAATAASIMTGADASAHASATATIGDVTVTQSGSGPNFGITNWDVSLDTGESVSRTFTYAVTMHTDGLPATRTWDHTTIFGCMPVHEFKCGPDPTGYEQTEVYLETYRDGRVANPFIQFTGTIAYDLFNTTAGTESFEGSFTLTATNLTLGLQSDSIGLLAAVWVDSNDSPPIPEPGNVALVLAGLAILFGRRISLDPSGAARLPAWRRPWRRKSAASNSRCLNR